MLALRRSLLALAVAALASSVPGVARAHFVLQSPPAMTEQNALGDPQKAPPCGDNGDAVPSGMVTAFKAGDTIKVTIDETIFHPGHYRIALAVNDVSELPEEPPVTPNDTPCGSAPIMNPPVFPVLADGVFVHTDPFDAPQSIDIKLPDDLSCDNCTLQIIQFMSNHGLNDPGGCYYHHCANISVEPAQAGTTSGGDSTSSGGDLTTTDATSTGTTTAASQGDTSGNGSDPTTSGDTAAGSTGSDSTATGGSGTSGGSTPDDDSGCGCTGTPGDGGPATLALLLGSLGLRARRKRAA